MTIRSFFALKDRDSLIAALVVGMLLIGAI